MAQRLDTVVPDILAPNATYLDGALEDEDVSVTGSPALAAVANSQYYFFSTIMKKAKTAFNGLVDNSLLSQYFNALKIVISGSEDAVDWDDTFTYNGSGTLVRDAEGDVYSSTGTASNLNKNPSNPANTNYWFPCKSNKEYREFAKSGEVLGGAMHRIHNRVSVDYQQNLLVGKKTIDGVDYEEHLIHLDNTVVTGNATLEALLVGYPWIDLYFPDNLGTRTAVDMSSRHIVPQSVGGENDTLAEVLKNRMIGHWHSEVVGADDTNGDSSNVDLDYRAAKSSDGALIGAAGAIASNNVTIRGAISDGVNPTPELGATNRPNEFTVGASYIIVQVAV